MLMKQQTLFFLTFLVFVFSKSVLALDPRHDYIKLESENFHVIFDAKSYEDAKDHFLAAERSYKLLADIFGETPSYTVLLVETDIDLANGAATSVPRPTIFSFSQPPTSLSSVNYFSNWPQDVILHEYAHTLNMEPTNGVFTPLRWVFGSFVRPNMFLPRWYLEGLAVEMESRFNSTGRLKSTDYDALIRAFVLDGSWGKENLSQINETTTPSWPQGQRPYFYGALLWHEIYERKGPEAVKNLNQRYGGRFPYFISAPIEDLLDGKDYTQLLKEIYEKYDSYAQEQIEKIKSKPVTIGRRIAIEDSLIQHSPSLSPDLKRLAFVNTTIDGDSEIYLLKRDKVNAEFSFNTGTKIKSISKTEIQKITWSPDSEVIYFDAIDTFDRYKLYFDLYSYNLKTEKLEQITKGQRAREPSVSLDGQTIIYVKAEGGQTALYAMDLKTRTSKVVYTPARNMRVSRPAFIDNSRIVFAQKKKNGSDQLRILNLSTNMSPYEMTLLDHSAQPVVTSQGIVFTSFDSGVENLYMTNFELRTVTPLTNSLTRILNGLYDPTSKTLYYSELSGQGVSLKKSTALSEALPKIPHPIKTDFENYTLAEKNTKADVPTKIPESEDYWAARYMFPQYWIPFVTSTEDGTITSLSIPGSDARGHHNYLISAQYDSRPKEWSSALTYAWINSIGTTQFSVFDTYTYYSSLDRATNDQGVSGEHQFFIPGLSNNFKGLLGFEYEKANIATSSSPDINHYFKGPFAGFNYSNLEQKITDIAPSGQNFFIKFTEYLPNNTDTEYRKTLAHFSHYHKAWLPKRHRLVFKATGVHTEKNRSILLGTTSSETPYTFGPVVEGFYLRGYPPGEFIGYSMALSKLEYKFPIADIYSGPDNPIPIFSKRLHGEIFVEALSLDGIYFEKDTDNIVVTDFKKVFWSAGAEGKLDLTILYHVPVTFVVGGAFGFSEEAQGEFRLYSLLQSPLLFQ